MADIDFVPSPLDQERQELDRKELELEQSDQLLQATLSVEKQMVRRIKVSLAVTVPACIVLGIGMVAVALALSDTSTGWIAPLSMAAGIGALAGLFFGVWAGIVLSTGDIEVLDHEALRQRARARNAPEPTSTA